METVAHGFVSGICNMLVHEGESRSSTIDRLLAAVLALVAGGVNSAGFLAFGFFSANMTGNVSMTSDNLSIGQTGLALAFLAIVVMFILGAFVAGLMIEIGKRNSVTNVYSWALLGEAALLMSPSILLATLTVPPDGVTIVAILSFAMGIQNAASTRISGSRVRTTHVSGVATDIGVGLAFLISGSRLTDRQQVISRLALHVTTLASFLIGGIAGVLGYQVFGSGVFCGFSLTLVAICVGHLLHSRMPAE